MKHNLQSLADQELARDLSREVLPKLQSAGVKLFLISIGPPERGTEFAELTGIKPNVPFSFAHA